MSLASVVYAAIAPADVSYAQGKAVSPPPVAGSAQPQPTQPREIKLGDGKTLVYEIGLLSPQDSWRSTSKVYGKIYYKPDGGFELGGVLRGIEFDYEHSHYPDGSVNRDVLALTTGGKKFNFIDESPSSKFKDSARINRVVIQFDSSNFYEGQVSNKPWATLTQYEKLRHIYQKWRERLNVGAIKAEAERLKIPEKKLLESLEVLAE